MKTISFYRIAVLIRNDIQRVHKFSSIVAVAVLIALFVQLYQSLAWNIQARPDQPFFDSVHLLKFHFQYFPVFFAYWRHIIYGLCFC